jgi:hypothetical protein
MEHPEIDSGPAYPNRITCFIDMLGLTRDVLDLEGCSKIVMPIYRQTVKPAPLPENGRR